MKKYIIKFSLVFLATFMFFGCNDDFLERYPQDEISDESFWSTENDLIVYNNSIYDYARDERQVNVLMGHMPGFESHQAGIWLVDEFTDNIAPLAARHILYQQVRAGKHQPTNGYKYYGWDARGW